MDDLKEKIKYEFDGEDNSFLIKIRVHLHWDHSHFVEVMNLFYNFILHNDNINFLERDIARGFWFYANFVKEWSSHVNFRAKNKYSNDYFNQAYEIIYFLADWYFTGECPFTEHQAFIEEFDRLNFIVKEH